MAKAMTKLESAHGDTGSARYTGSQWSWDVTLIQIRDIAEARRFYQEVLGCLEDTYGDPWLHFNLYGHPIVCRLNPQLGKQGRVASHYRLVDGKYVPIARSGVVLAMREWRSLAKRLKQHRIKCVIEPYGHVKNCPGIQATLFLEDPSGNTLEVQSFCNSAKEFLRCERQRALARWMPWAVLTAFIMCCILLLPKTSEDEIAAGNLSLPAHLPPCVRAGLCAP
jgi:extradiol dioxygenase family protein